LLKYKTALPSLRQIFATSKKNGLKQLNLKDFNKNNACCHSTTQKLPFTVTVVKTTTKYRFGE